MKSIAKIITILILLPVFYILPGFARYIPDWIDNHKLLFQVERPFTDLNFRDLGKSLNECGQNNPYHFKQSVIFRGNRFFSGWACEDFGNPDHIFTLNFVPKDNHEYFCRNNKGILVGSYTNFDFQIDSIENLSNWEIPRFRTSMCEFFKNMYSSIAQNEKIFVHCDAGRDRTGAVSALLTSTMLEVTASKIDYPHLGDIIECDYRKSRTLTQTKYGKMRKLIYHLRDLGGSHNFIAEKCNIPIESIKSAALNFVSFKSPTHTR